MVEQTKNFECRRAIKVPSRLVSEHDKRLVDKRPGDRDSLALATGESCGKVAASVGESDLVK